MPVWKSGLFICKRGRKRTGVADHLIMYTIFVVRKFIFLWILWSCFKTYISTYLSYYYFLKYFYLTTDIQFCSDSLFVCKNFKNIYVGIFKFQFGIYERVKVTWLDQPLSGAATYKIKISVHFGTSFLHDFKCLVW